MTYRGKELYKKRFEKVLNVQRLEVQSPRYRSGSYYRFLSYHKSGSKRDGNSTSETKKRESYIVSNIINQPILGR